MKMVPGSRNVKRSFKKKQTLKALLFVYWRIDRKTVGICFDLVVLHGDDQHLVRRVRLISTNCTFCFLFFVCFFYTMTALPVNQMDLYSPSSCHHKLL